MTVAELIEQLKEFPPESPVVYFHFETHGDDFVAIETVETRLLKLDKNGDYQRAQDGEVDAVLCVDLIS